MTMGSILQSAFDRHRAVFDETFSSLMPDIERAAVDIKSALKQGATIFACGNGGSAADAQHFVAEWVCKYRDDRRPLPAIALSVDTSVLTAIGNDYGFEEVFARQVTALGKKGDVLVAFTTSGSSKNVLRAIEVARKKGMYVVVLTGAKGARLRDSADCAIIVPSEETARIQEIHQIIYHAWCEYGERNEE